MSRTIEAMVFYGILLDRDHCPWCDVDMLPDEYYARLRGVVPSDFDDRDHSHAAMEARSAYPARVYEIYEASECHVDLYGYGEGMRYFVCAAASLSRTEPWETKALGPMPIKGSWACALQEFCKVMGIPFPRPAWHLACYAE